MFHHDLNDSSTLVPGARFSSCGSATSMLCAPTGVQPNMSPEPDHHRWLPDGTMAGSMIRAFGSGVAYASALWTFAPSRTYDVPSARCHSIRLISDFESRKPLTTVSPGLRILGTI